MAPALPFVAAASIGANTLGQIASGRAEAKALKYSASVNDVNADIANQNAIYAGQEGEANAAIQQEKTRQQVGSIKTQQAASGIDINKGSAVDVRASQAETGMLDAMTIRANAARQAYGYQTQEQGFKTQAGVDRAGAKSVKKASYIKAASTLLGSAATAYSSNALGGGSSPWGKQLSSTGISSGGFGEMPWNAG